MPFPRKSLISSGRLIRKVLSNIQNKLALSASLPQMLRKAQQVSFVEPQVFFAANGYVIISQCLFFSSLFLPSKQHTHSNFGFPHILQFSISFLVALLSYDVDKKRPIEKSLNLALPYSVTQILTTKHARYSVSLFIFF